MSRFVSGVRCGSMLLVASLVLVEQVSALHFQHGIRLKRIGTYETGVFDGPAAEIADYDPASKRAFVTNSAANAIDVLDLSRPFRPSLLFQIDVSSYGAAPTHVAVRDGIVAAAVPADPQTNPGRVVFFDANGTYLGDVPVGALPDQLTFTPDGSAVLVANEGEPDDGVDPEGSISVIDLSSGVGAATVATADFHAFDDRAQYLRNRGVRLFPDVPGPVSVSQELEPEYIAVAEDGSTAFATLQEASAVAKIDLSDVAHPTVVDIVGLGVKDHELGQPHLRTFEIRRRPPIGRVRDMNGRRREILLGGFSGLFFEGYDPDGKLLFVTHPDRGPNGEPTDLLPGIPGNERPFPLPDYQPEIVRLSLDLGHRRVRIVDRIPLTTPDGPLTGLPNLQAGASGTAYTDEVPVDLKGNLLANDPLGADLEGIAIDPRDGSYWMVDEYRPAVYHFDASGMLLKRLVPDGTAAAAGEAPGTFGDEALPAVYAQRRANRGFEAVALNTESLKLYAFIQSPLDNPDTTNDASSKASSVLRILELDVAAAASPSVSGEFVYLLDGAQAVDKIGDAVWRSDSRFFTVERDSGVGPESQKLVFEIDLKGATNLQTDVYSPLPGQTLEQHDADELAAAGIQPVSKRKVLNLPSIGYVAGDKAEGLALVPLPDGTFALAVINDNDFGLGADPVPGDGRVPFNPDPVPEVLGLISFDGKNGFDASDRDDAIHIVPHPAFGLYMPDGIGTYEVDDQTFFVTANEGDDRGDFGDGRGDASRLKDLAVDPVRFAADIQDDENLGRWNVSAYDGDLDGDGLLDQLVGYGGRSFSIWDENGNLVFDSGQILEEITAAAFPNDFNSTNDENDSFDNRSDNKGPEPEVIDIGEAFGRTYAFVGLERIGGIVSVDISDPRKPRVVDYVNERDFSGDAAAGTAGPLGPEGIRFVPREASPFFLPLVLVANEVSGSTDVYVVLPKFGRR